jgi:death-on-curing protein
VIEPAWIAFEAVLLLHEESIAEHGGLAGVRDLGLLQSALARPQNLFAYEGVSDIARLAAAYAAGIARNYPFVDGNKRAAFLSIGLFVAINGWRLVADKAEATLVMLDLAAGELEEEALAGWIRARLERRTPQP